MTKSIFTLLFAAVLVTAALASPEKPVNLTCENLTDPVGIDAAAPLFGWQIDESADSGWKQDAYRIRVAGSEADLHGETSENLLWDTGWVCSDQTRNIRYEGAKLESSRTYYWNVQIRGTDGALSESNAGIWKTGILDPKEWKADWIGTGESFSVSGDGSARPFDPWFRKTFTLDSPAEQALLHLVSVGYHEVWINGTRTDSAVLTPCVSDHSRRARSVTYDITPLLRTGKNVIGVWLGTGWSINSEYAVEGRPNAPIFKAQCDILTGGAVTQILSDETWKHAPSGNKLLGHFVPGQFGGEYQEPRSDDWASVDFDDTAWKNGVVCHPNLAVSAQSVEKNRAIPLDTPVTVTPAGENTWRVDMGRNFAGWTEIEVEGEPGTVAEFLYSESPLSEQTFNLFSRVKIGNSGRAVFKNRFNYSSGRWITIRGLKKCPDPNKIHGWQIRTDTRRASSFECSDELQNWIYNTIIWTFENLSVGGYIVDCPQRERMGYGGDAHATCETGMFNYAMAAFYKKWMEDWRDVQGWHQAWLDDVDNINPGQTETALRGTLPNTAPTYFGGGGPAWGGIVVTLPWFYYQQYGDKSILTDNFDLMTRWLDFVNCYVKDGLLRRYGDQWNFLGDWLWPGAPGSPNSDEPDTLCLNNIYRVFNLRTAAKIAHVLGHSGKEAEWLALAEEGRTAVNKTWFHPEDASYFDGRPSIQAAALLAEIPEADDRDRVKQRLDQEILVNDKGHIGSGITGGALLFRYLRQEGRNDLIWSMVSQTDYPGWGFMRENGATTIWEAWELNKPGHSLLHSSYLYAGSWYIDSVLGIQNDPEDVGFRRIVIHPPKYDDTGIEWARGHFDAPTGKISVDWKKNTAERSFRMEVTIPPNTTATVYLPSTGSGESNGSDGARMMRTRGVPGYSVYTIPSGTYQFTSGLK